MDNLLDLTAPLSANGLASEGIKKQLRNVQGNILKAHGRDNAVHLLLDISDATPTKDIKDWLGTFSLDVTSAAAQMENRGKRGNAKTLFASVFLTAVGYRRLGYPVAQFRDPSFVAGMKVAGPEQLGDPEVAQWQRPYREPVHAMLLLASDDAEVLGKKVHATTERLTQMGVYVTSEVGLVRRDEAHHLQDPFKFAHGMSQPLFFEDDVSKQHRPNPAGTEYGMWDPSAAPSLVLVRDPLGGDGALGSYLVFRKLEMDVDGFNVRLGKLAKALGLGGDARVAEDRAAALIVGRYRNGAPLILPLGTPPEELRQTNDFDYSHDPKGRICPFQSHVRKGNPRGSGKDGLADERNHRIARRGVNYKDPPVDGGKPKEGMLFMCYQAKIQRQFEFMQKRWLNGADFPAAGNGHDPIVAWGDRWRPQPWPVAGDRDETMKFSFGGFVQLRGGDYFFAPSLPFLFSLREATR